MAKYRKLPVEIEAFKYDGDLKGSDGNYYVPDWAVSAFENGTMYYSNGPDELQDAPPCELWIKTLEGDHHVSVGDFVIRGVKDELYPCKPDIFKMTYEDATSEIVSPTITVNIGDIHLSNDNLKALTEAISSGIVREMPLKF